MAERQFYEFQRAWWKSAQPDPERIEFMVGYYDPDGGCHGEFALRYHKFDKRGAFRLEAFHDSWAVLVNRFDDLLKRLASDEPNSPDDVRSLLVDLGITDFHDGNSCPHDSQTPSTSTSRRYCLSGSCSRR